jgi:hypothetical protein
MGAAQDDPAGAGRQPSAVVLECVTFQGAAAKKPARIDDDFSVVLVNVVDAITWREYP